MNAHFYDYRDKQNTYEGYLAYEGTEGMKKPCILLFHAWAGQGDFDREQAEKFAKLGYIAFAVDLYGKGLRASGPNKVEMAQQLMKPLISDRSLLRDRIRHVLETAQKLPQVDPDRIGALGFCFGGLCALDAARAGLDGLKAAVSLHGNLSPSNLDNSKTITTKILIGHGYADPTVSHEAMNSVMEELTAAKADWQMLVLGNNTMHGFTEPKNNTPEKGLQYQPINSQRAFKSAQELFEEAFTI